MNHLNGAFMDYTVKQITFFSLLMTFLLPAAGIGQSSLAAGVKQLVEDPALRSGSVGLMVMEVNSGKVLAEHQANKTMIPASIQKVLTTATALGILGKDHVFETYLQYDGRIDDQGVLHGNLYITGTGDPTLGSSEMDGVKGLEDVMARFRMAVQQKGIRRIEGHIVGDGTYFETAVGAPNWPWSDLGNYYASGAWGLNIHENLYFLRFQQVGQMGETPRIAEIEPAVPGLSFRNEIKSAARNSGDNAYIYGAPYTYQRYVRGTIPIGASLFSIKGAIPDPPLFTAQYLEQSLRTVGIVSDRGAVSQLDLEASNGQRTTLYAHQSPPLVDIIDRANKKSVNLYCESMLKAMGKVRSGEGSFEAGVEAVEEYWKSRGLSLEGVFIQDGSGLSPRNGLTASFLAQVLRLSARDQALAEPLLASLPQAGKSGNLQSKFGGTAAEGKLWAKSGTIGRVRTYAGYATGAGGKQLAFVVMANDYTGSGSAMRQKLDRFLLSLF